MDCHLLSELCASFFEWRTFLFLARIRQSNTKIKIKGNIVSILFTTLISSRSSAELLLKYDASTNIPDNSGE